MTVAVVVIDAICAVAVDAGVRVTLIHVEFTMGTLCAQRTLASITRILLFTNATIFAWL